VMGCHDTPFSRQQRPVTPQPRSNLVKHPLQNTENDCHQWLPNSCRVYQIRFRPGLRQEPTGRATALPRPPA